MAMLEQAQGLQETPPHLELLEQIRLSKQEFTEKLQFFGDVGNFYQQTERSDLNVAKQNSHSEFMVSPELQPDEYPAMRQSGQMKQSEAVDSAKSIQKRAPI